MKRESKNAVFSSLKELIALRADASIVGLHVDKKNSSFITGIQRSFFKTKGMNFEEVRPYQQGDDSRQIDWRVTAKHGKPFTKVYVDDTIHQVYLITDLQNQMFFASRGDFKSVVAARVNALISWIALNQKGILNQTLIVQQGIKSFKPIQVEENLTSFFKQLLKLMPRKNQSQSDFLLQSIQNEQKQLKKGSLLFIISDFSDVTPDLVQEIKKVGAHHSVILIHIFDLMEEKLPSGILPFTDGISDFSIDTRSARVRKIFETDFKNRQNIIKEAAKKAHAVYLSLQTDENYIQKVIQLLNKKGVAHGK